MGKEDEMGMRFRNRFNDAILAAGPGVTAGGSGSGAMALRAEANHFLSVGDDVISRTLSGDSEAHIRSGVQQGGQ